MNRIEIFLAALALAMICAKPLVRLVGAIANALKDAIQVSDSALNSWLTKFKGWLLREGMPQPFSLFMSVILLIVLAIATWADFKIVERSIAVIWPWGEGAALLAGALVAVVGVLAYLFHTYKNFLARTILGLMLLSLISIQGVLAYIRTVEIEKTRIELAVSDSAPETQLVIGPAPEEQAQPPQASAQPPSDAPAPLYYRLLPVLAALWAVFLSTAEAVGFSRLTSGAGSTALTWMIFGPVLFLNWILASFFAFLRGSNFSAHFADVLVFILDCLQLISEKLLKLCKAFFDLLEHIQQRLVALFSFLGPAAVYTRRSRKRDLKFHYTLDEIRRQTGVEIERLLAIREVERFQNELLVEQSGQTGREQVAAMAAVTLGQFSQRVAELRRTSSMYTLKTNGNSKQQGDGHDDKTVAPN